MLKWYTSTADEKPGRLNKVLLWLLILFIVSALALGVFPWLTFFSVLPQYRQSLMLWGL